MEGDRHTERERWRRGGDRHTDRQRKRDRDRDRKTPDQLNFQQGTESDGEWRLTMTVTHYLT